jgi:hypothetical protein
LGESIRYKTRKSSIIINILKINGGISVSRSAKEKAVEENNYELD